MREIKRLVIHHTRNHNTPELVRKLHITEWKWDDVGCHFFISKNGEIIKARPVEKQGAHVKGHNEDTIGIDLLGNLHLQPPTREQLQGLKSLTKQLMQQYNIKKENIFTHYQLNPKIEESCPGVFFSIKNFKKML